MTGERVSWSAHAAAGCILLAATLVMFSDVLFSGSGKIPSLAVEDLARIFFYWEPFAFGELKKGHLVLWNPHSFAGAPFLAGFQPGLLYPPNWLHMVLPPALAINLGIALHVFLAGVWVYLWTRHRDLHPAACTLAGLIFMFCGAHFLQLYRGHLPHLRTLIWAPLILLAVDGVLQARSLRWLLVGMVAVAMQILAGNAQYALYTAIIAAIYALARWITSERRWPEAGALAAIYAGGASLAAIQLFTGFAAVPESLLAGLSYATAAGGALPPENLLTLVLPGILGDEIAVPYWGRWTLSETSLFIGAAPALLALYGIVRGDRRVTRVSLGMALIALVLAFGDFTPLFAVLYAHVPGFQSVRGIAKFGVLASLFLVMLVAVGFDRLLRDPRVPRWLIAVALLGGGTVWAAGLLVRSDCRAGGMTLWRPALAFGAIFEEALRMFTVDASASRLACLNTGASLLIGGTTFVVLGLIFGATRKSRRLVYVVGVVGVLEVMVYARYTRPTFESAPLVARSGQLRRILEQRDAFGSRLSSSDPNQYLALAAGGYDVWGSADLVLDRYARFIASTQGWPVEAILVTRGLRTRSPRLGMLRLGHELRVDGERVALVPTGLDVLPRALLVARWKVMPTRDAVLAAMADPTFDPRRIVLLESDPGIAPGGAEEPGSVTIRDVSSEVFEVRADVSGPAILLITDNYSADWRATPMDGDGGTYRVLPANYTLRGIPLTAGTHRFRLAYRPRAFVVGTYVTMLSLLLYAGAAAFEWRRSVRRRRRETASA